MLTQKAKTGFVRLSRDAIISKGLTPAGFLCTAKPNKADRPHQLALMGSCFIYSGAELTFPSLDKSMDLEITGSSLYTVMLSPQMKETGLEKALGKI